MDNTPFDSDAPVGSSSASSPAEMGDIADAPSMDDIVSMNDMSSFAESMPESQALAVKPANRSAASLPDNLRVPPHSLEAEQSVLGGLMLDENGWERIADKVIEEDFYRHDHRLIFEAIRKLIDSGQPADAVTVAEHLEHAGTIDKAGGLAYIADLANSTPSAANIVAYANIVRERSVLRQLVQVGATMTESAFTPEGRSVAELLEAAESEVFKIRDQTAKGSQSFRSAKDLLGAVVERIDELFNSDGNVTGLPTGLVDFDGKTGGLQPGDLVIVAGRPSMGKTSFAMNLAEHAVIKEKVPTAVYSMEMPAEQLIMRMMSSLGQIDQSAIRSGDLTDHDWAKITSTVSLLNDAPLYIDDSPGLSPTEVRARARRLKREHGLGLILVDYLQLMQIPGSKENRTAEISEISRTLKAIAKELEVPVIALSQLNRNLESRPDKRPVMSDLRESGGIEQDADLIVFIYRDEVYNKESTEKGIAEIIIGKQRNGPIGTVKTTFRGQYTRFDNFVPTHDDAYL